MPHCLLCTCTADGLHACSHAEHAQAAAARKLLCRQEILGQYAQHLPAQDLQALASMTERMSGRDLRDVCEQAERQDREETREDEDQQVAEDALPTVDMYKQAALQRAEAMKAKPGPLRSMFPGSGLSLG